MASGVGFAEDDSGDQRDLIIPPYHSIPNEPTCLNSRI